MKGECCVRREKQIRGETFYLAVGKEFVHATVPRENHPEQIVGLKSRGVVRMIKIGERYQLKYDGVCWVLHVYAPGKDKDGNEKLIKKSPTYYPKTRQALSKIIDLEAGAIEAEGLEEIREEFDAMEDRLARLLAAAEEKDIL